MDIQAMDHHLGAGGIEVFVLNLADGAAVGGIGIIRAETGHIKQVRAPADFLVGNGFDLRQAAMTLTERGYKRNDVYKARTNVQRFLDDLIADYTFEEEETDE